MKMSLSLSLNPEQNAYCKMLRVIASMYSRIQRRDKSLVEPVVCIVRRCSDINSNAALSCVELIFLCISQFVKKKFLFSFLLAQMRSKPANNIMLIWLFNHCRPWHVSCISKQSSKNKRDKT